MVTVNGSENVTTERLLLSPMAPGDLAELFPIFHNPQGWTHDPAGRHLTVGTSRAFIERAAAKWQRDGQSYWTVRLRSSGEVIGMGGVQRHSSGGWNLAYRIAWQHWGHGYATEIGAVAIEAAHSVDNTVPVIAWILPINESSRRVAERLGLVNYGERVDTNDGQRRLAYADRPLEPVSPDE
jgi:RimJ/RimL family protein N-acetyltransferase